MMLFARLIGRVGFQQQGFQWKGRDDLAQAPCAFIRHGTADADAKPEPPQLACLFRAAREAVHHAAQRFAEPTQLQNDPFERAARVQYQRQIELVRDRELAA
jgi:hypothetical protein